MCQGGLERPWHQKIVEALKTKLSFGPYRERRRLCRQALERKPMEDGSRRKTHFAPAAIHALSRSTSSEIRAGYFERLTIGGISRSST